MTVKEKIVDIFEHNKGRFLSGEELGEKIGCTRGSVWKAVKLLQNDGYDIVSVTNKGYCLLENNDVISEEGIKSFLKDDTVPFDMGSSVKSFPHKPPPAKSTTPVFSP